MGSQMSHPSPPAPWHRLLLCLVTTATIFVAGTILGAVLHVTFLVQATQCTFL